MRDGKSSLLVASRYELIEGCISGEEVQMEVDFEGKVLLGCFITSERK